MIAWIGAWISANLWALTATTVVLIFVAEWAWSKRPRYICTWCRKRRAYGSTCKRCLAFK